MKALLSCDVVVVTWHPAPPMVTVWPPPVLPRPPLPSAALSALPRPAPCPFCLAPPRPAFLSLPWYAVLSLSVILSFLLPPSTLPNPKGPNCLLVWCSLPSHLLHISFLFLPTIYHPLIPYPSCPACTPFVFPYLVLFFHTVLYNTLSYPTPSHSTYLKLPTQSLCFFYLTL